MSPRSLGTVAVIKVSVSVCGEELFAVWPASPCFVCTPPMHERGSLGLFVNKDAELKVKKTEPTKGLGKQQRGGPFALTLPAGQESGTWYSVGEGRNIFLLSYLCFDDTDAIKCV